MLKKIGGFILNHLIWSSVLALVIIGGGYWTYKTLATNSAGEIRYVLAAVEKGTLITSVSGSGQIAVSSQVEIKSKASGSLTYLNAKNGQEVKAGALIVRVDARDAYKAIRDARTSLESARIALQKAEAPPEELTITQAEDALTLAKESKQKAEDNLRTAYENGYNSVSTIFLELPAIMTGMNDIIYGTNINSSQSNIDYYFDNVKTIDEAVYQYKFSVENDYKIARAAYDRNFNDYKTVSRSSDSVTIEKLISESYDTAKKISQAVKSMNNLLQFYKDKLTERGLKPVSATDTYLSSLSSYTTKTNSEVSSMSSSQQSIQSSKDAIVSAERTIEDKTTALIELNKPIDPLDIRSEEISVQQRQDALWDAQSKLADYAIRAPFDGIFAKVSVSRGDIISSGTAIATFITKQKIAEISLNEVDVAKVKVGQKVTLIFDAVSDLTITGEVGEIDTLGTISQGVVSYNVKIIFDTQDDRVKPGMSVSASIMTAVRQDVLVIANSAIKSSGNGKYVEMLDGVSDIALAASAGVTSVIAPKQQIIELGLVNDTMTEITNGLKQGDMVIVRTINPAATTTKTTQGQSLLQVSGGGARAIGGGGFGR